MNLNGKVAVITGGAKGIGYAITKQLAQLGASVVINYNASAHAAEALVESLSKEGLQASCFQADISKFEDAQKLLDFAVSTYGKIDILINNAGLTKDGLILRMSEEDFDQVIATNLKGTWNCCKQAIKYMSKQRYGKIINISSVVGVTGNAGQSNYCASKAGIIGLTKSLAREVAKRNICVNAIAPGLIKTQMTDVLSDDIINQIQSSIPLGRFGDIEEVANAVSFLASDLSNYITGHVLHVDGGLAM